MEAKKHPFVVPSTTVTEVEIESTLCNVSKLPNVNQGDPIEKERHVEIKEQTDGGSMDFTDSGWD